MSFKIQYLCRERKAMRPKMAEIRESQFCLFKFSKTVLPIRRPQERGVDVHGCSVPTHRNLGFAPRPRTPLRRGSGAGNPARGQALSGPADRKSVVWGKSVSVRL